MPTEKIEIKKYEQLENKPEKSSDIGLLIQKNNNEFKKMFENYLVSKKVDIFDPNSSETILQKDGSFLIAKKNPDGSMTEIIKIKGKDKVDTESIMADFVKYIINSELSTTYKDAMVTIETNEIKISNKSNLIELKKEVVPTVEDMGLLIQAVDAEYDSIQKVLGGFVGKGYVNEQMRINKEIIQTIVKGHYKDVRFINDDIYKKTGYDSFAGKKKGTGTEWRPQYDETLIRQKNDLMYVHRQFEKISKLISDPRYMRGEFSITDSDIIDFGLFGVEELHKFSNLLSINLGIDKARTEEAMGIAMKELEDEDFKLLFDHLKGVTEGKIDPTKTEFKPKNIKKVEKLVNDYPFLQKYVNLNLERSDKKSSYNAGAGYYETNKNTGGADKAAGGVETTEQAKAAADYQTRQDALAKGGIAGLSGYGLDQTKMTAEQKKMWGGVGNLALTGGMIFVGWKMISSAWKLLRKTSKNDNERRKAQAWLLGPAAIIFGSQALTGEGPLALIKGGKGSEWFAGWIGGWFGGKKETKEGTTENKTVLKYGEGLTGVTAMFSDMKYNEVATFLEEDGKGNMKIKEDSYEDAIKAYEDKDNKVAVEFLKSIGKSDKKNLIHLGLTAMGIKSLKTLEDAPDAKFNETAADAIVKVQSVSDRMREGGYDNINPDNMDLIEAYIADKDAKIDELDKLEARGDVFEKDAEKVDQTGNKAVIKLISNGDLKKEEVLTRALNKFYAYMPSADKKVEVAGTWPTIEFKTYENTTTVNLETKSIELLAKFSSYLEAFKAASLINFLKKAFKDKQAQSENPFSITMLGKDVKFDDSKTRSFGIDTEAVTAGPGGSLSDISATLEANKEAFCTYLNDTQNVAYKKYVAKVS